MKSQQATTLVTHIQRVRSLCFVRDTRVTNHCVVNASFENSAYMRTGTEKVSQPQSMGAKMHYQICGIVQIGSTASRKASPTPGG